MIPEDLLFWVAPISSAPGDDRSVLCRRHADAMSVPRGWTLDDRREDIPRLFMPARFDADDQPTRRATRTRRAATAAVVEQLVIDGTGEVDRPDLDVEDADAAADADVELPEPGVERTVPDVDPTHWNPTFDHDDDLDGLLEVSSPLLSRAFRGGERRSS